MIKVQQRFTRAWMKLPPRSQPQQRLLTSSNNAAATDGLVGWEVRPVNETSDRFIGMLTLQSPATYNALTVDMGRRFQSLCRELTEDITSGAQKVDAIILTGQGDDAFSAGGVLDWLKSLRNKSVHANADLMVQFYKYFLAVRSIPVPVIAAMHGPAMGAGAGLALACDLRTAEPRPKILGLHFTRLGIHSGLGSSHYLRQTLTGGSTMVNEILLNGKILSGEECYKLGLVNRLSDDARQSAWEMAKDIVLHEHPLAVRLTLQTLRAQQDVGLEQAIQREALAQALCYARHDWGEGVKAIAEKRDPKFDPYHSK